MKKRFAVRLAACFTVFAVCSAALAAQATVLTIEDAVQMAFNNNISLERNALTLQGLERAKNHAWNSFSPSLSVGGGFQMPNKPAAQGLPYDYALYGQAAVGFNISPALIAAIKTASLQFEAGELSFNEAVRSIELSVRQAFYGLLYERAYIEQQERSLETARQQYEQNRRQYQAGRISELDVPMNPAAKGQVSMNAWFTKLTEADFQKERDEVLGATAEDIRKTADLVEAALAQNHLCVIGSEAAIQKEKDLFGAIDKL